MKAWVMRTEGVLSRIEVAEESWPCWEEGDGFVKCTHGLGGPCYRSRLRRMATEDGGRHAKPQRTVLRMTVLRWMATEDGGRHARPRRTVLRWVVLRWNVLRWVGGVYEKTRKTQGIAGS
jgi:hypothetical protein